MENYSFAFITPSYAPDFERCKLLCWSIKQFVASPVKHYIVVENKDLPLFQQLADENTIILSKEKILPSWFKRVPFFDAKNVWLNLKGYRSGTFLLRGWLIQQIVKLAAAEYTQEDVLVFLDSDVAFIDKFDVHTLLRGDKVRLFRVDHKTNQEIGVGQKWKETAKKLLGLPPQSNYYDFYVNQIVTWRRDVLLDLYKRIESVSGRNWVEAVSGVNHLSEYVLYGVFANYVAGEESGHYDDHLQKICWSYWEEKKLTDEGLKAFFQEAKSTGHSAVMISAKSSMQLSIEEFQTYLSYTGLFHSK